MILRSIITVLLIPCLIAFGGQAGTGFEKTSKKDSSDVLTYQSLYDEIVKQGIEYPDIVFAQAILESGHFKSKVYKQNNNLFGMKLPKKRSTVASKSRNGYAVYGSWKESVEDYKLYQEYYFKGRQISRSSYFSNLDKRYSVLGGSYSSLVRNIIKKSSKRVKYVDEPYLNNGIFGDSLYITSN